MHILIHGRQEITLARLHLLRGRERGRDRGKRGGLAFLLTQFPPKTTSLTVDWRTLWLAYKPMSKAQVPDSYSSWYATECEAGCVADKLHWWTKLRGTAFKAESSPPFVLLSSQTEPVQFPDNKMPADIYLWECVCVLVCVCVRALDFILQSGLLLLGNIEGLEQSLGRYRYLTLTHFHSIAEYLTLNQSLYSVIPCSLWWPNK